MPVWENESRYPGLALGSIAPLEVDGRKLQFGEDVVMVLGWQDCQISLLGRAK